MDMKEVYRKPPISKQLRWLEQRGVAGTPAQLSHNSEASAANTQSFPMLERREPAVHDIWGTQPCSSPGTEQIPVIPPASVPSTRLQPTAEGRHEPFEQTATAVCDTLAGPSNITSIVLTGKRSDASVTDPSKSEDRHNSPDASSGCGTADEPSRATTTQSQPPQPAPARTSEAANSSRSSHNVVCEHARYPPAPDPDDPSDPGLTGTPAPRDRRRVWEWGEVWHRVKLITDLVGHGKRPAPDATIQKQLLSGQWVIYTKDTACHSDPYALNPFYVNSTVKLPTTIEFLPANAYIDRDGLPPLDVRSILPPPFTGDIRAYRSFRDQFISAVHSRGLFLSDAQRLELLRPLLQGKAAIRPNFANECDSASLYHLTTATLAYEYEARPEFVQYLLFNDLLAIPAATNCVAELRRLNEQLLDVFQMMLDWGFDHRSRHLEWYLQAKLPLPASMNILRKKSTLPTWDSFAFFDAMEEMLALYDEAVSLLGYGMPAASEGTPSRSGEVDRSQTHAEAFIDREPPLKQPGPRCSYCTTTKNAVPHWSTQCPTFTTCRSRHKRAKALQLCYVCLRRGHQAGHKTCRAMLNRLCAYCQRQRHHKSLCRTYLNKVHSSTTSGRRRVLADAPRRRRRRHRTIPGPYANAEALRRQNGTTPPTDTEQGAQSARSSTIEGKVEASSTVRSEDRCATSSTTPTRRTTGHQRSQAIRGAMDREDPVKRPPSFPPPKTGKVKSSGRNSAARRDGTSERPMLKRSVAKPAECSVTQRPPTRGCANKSVIRQTSQISAKLAPSPQQPSMRGDHGADHDEDQKSPNWTEPRSTSAADASLREGALETGRGPAAPGNCPAHPSSAY